jgi:hypothetical protein
VAADLRADPSVHQSEPQSGVDAPVRVAADDARRLLFYLYYCLGSWPKAATAVEQTLLELRRQAGCATAPVHVLEVAQRVQFRLNGRSARRSAETPAGASVDAEFERIARAAERLDQLAPDVRRAVCLREWDRMPFDEIAATLGLDAAGVERLFFLARRAGIPDSRDATAASAPATAPQTMQLAASIADGASLSGA